MSLRPARVLGDFICQSCRYRATTQTRGFSSTQTPRANTNAATSALSGLSSSIQRNANTASNQRVGFNNAIGRNSAGPDSALGALDSDPDTLMSERYHDSMSAAHNTPPHRLHVYAHKHNTIITFVQPPRSAAETTSSGISSTNASAADQKKMVDVLLSLSTGNIGFRKAGRGGFDAAYQLAAYTLKQIQEKGMLRDIKKLEVVLRGFGAGREAVTKALLGTEGRMLRGRISSVVDATRLKLGGPRSPKPRRLG
ncbi:hypothetical protein MBLNU230_g4461t1 [Neophaeotheca triangularis]